MILGDVHKIISLLVAGKENELTFGLFLQKGKKGALA